MGNQPASAVRRRFASTGVGDGPSSAELERQGLPLDWAAPLPAGAAAFLITLSGMFGLLPGTSGWFSAPGLFAWLALWALPSGFLAGSAGLGRLAPLPPLAWAALGVILGRDLPDPAGAVLAVSALHAGGVALAQFLPGRALAGGGAALLAAGLFAALPSGGGALGHPWPLPLTALLLDLSPLVWVFESAGVDWMRHPSVYELAGAGDLGPDLRVAWPGWRSALPAFLVTTAVAGLAAHLRDRRGRA